MTVARDERGLGHVIFVKLDLPLAIAAIQYREYASCSDTVDTFVHSRHE